MSNPSTPPDPEPFSNSLESAFQSLETLFTSQADKYSELEQAVLLKMAQENQASSMGIELAQKIGEIAQEIQGIALKKGSGESDGSEHQETESGIDDIARKQLEAVANSIQKAHDDLLVTVKNSKTQAEVSQELLSKLTGQKGV